MKKKTKIRLITFFPALLVIGYLAISIINGFTINQAIKLAETQYQGDQVEVLVSWLNNEAYSLDTRNSAIWALGQIGDRRALNTLKKHYNGQPCNHDKAICQYELKKAIKYCNGAVNITTIIWKPFVMKKRSRSQLSLS